MLFLQVVRLASKNAAETREKNFAVFENAVVFTVFPIIKIKYSERIIGEKKEKL